MAVQMARAQPTSVAVSSAVVSWKSPMATEVRDHRSTCPGAVTDTTTGVVLSNTSRVLPPQSDTERDADAGESEEQNIEVRVMEEVGDFDQVVVWGHEVAPDENEDPYSKGIGEWLSFSEAVSAPEELSGF